MRTKLLALWAALLVCAVVAPLQAANLVLNGDFEMLSMTSGNAAHSTIIGNGTNGLPTATNWRSSNVGSGAGYNFVMVNNPTYQGTPLSLTGADDRFDDAYTNGAAGGAGGAAFSLWGPDSGSNNGLTNSPVGGNFLAADGSYLNRPVEQTITGLVVGQTYYLSFYWAAAQQRGLLGSTKEAWVICIGTCEYRAPNTGVFEGLTFFDADPGNTDIADPRPNNRGSYDPLDTSLIFKTDVVTNPERGFTPWKFESFEFTATASTTTLSLLAYGTPIGQPPFSLIDGISIDTPVPAPVPEPSTWAMMLIGFGIVGGVMRTRRRSLTDHRGRNAQII